MTGLSSLCIEVRNLSLYRAHVAHKRFNNCWPLPHVTGSPDLRVLSANLTSISPSVPPPLRDRSRVVPRSDSACVFTKRSVVKMQALRNRVESLESM